MYSSVINYLPEIFKAKKAGLFFIDHKDPKFMFTISEVGEDGKGVKYIETLVKFPSNLGFTGAAIRLKKTLIYTPAESRKEEDTSNNDIEFLEEVDNYVNETSVKWAMYSPIIDSQGTVQGVVQVLNWSSHGDLINQPNTQIFISEKL